MLRRHKGPKDKRRPYRGSRAFDPSCRSHGGCAHCREGRQHRNRKREDGPDAESVHRD